MSSRRLPGLRHVDHAAFTVPDLDEAVDFFVEVLGAEELYRSRRGPDPSFMPLHFDVPPDASLELSMLRFPPNLNIELFQWHSADKRPDHPRHSDRGGHHLCLIVDDVDDAVAHLRTHPRRGGARRPQGSGPRQSDRCRQPLDVLSDAMGLAHGTRRPFPGQRPPQTRRT